MATRKQIIFTVDPNGKAHELRQEGYEDALELKAALGYLRRQLGTWDRMPELEFVQRMQPAMDGKRWKRAEQVAGYMRRLEQLRADHPGQTECTYLFMFMFTRCLSCSFGDYCPLKLAEALGVADDQDVVATLAALRSYIGGDTARALKVARYLVRKTGLKDAALFGAVNENTCAVKHIPFASAYGAVTNISDLFTKVFINCADCQGRFHNCMKVMLGRALGMSGCDLDKIVPALIRKRRQLVMAQGIAHKAGEIRRRLARVREMEAAAK